MHLLTAFVLVAAGVPGASPESNPIATAPMFSYEVRYVSTNELDWRGTFDPRLKPVSRQGGSAVWAADASALRDLFEFWGDGETTNITAATKGVGASGGEVWIVNEQTTNYVGHVERVADGPANQASSLVFKPEIAHLNTGIRARLSDGRLEGLGLLAKVDIGSDRLLEFRTSQYSEEVVPAAAPGTDRVGKPRPKRISATIQIPEVDSARVEGEWVIPRDGALIVSLGTSVTRGKLGRESRSEQLLVIGYRSEQDQDPSPIDPVETSFAPSKRLAAPSGN